MELAAALSRHCRVQLGSRRARRNDRRGRPGERARVPPAERIGDPEGILHAARAPEPCERLGRHSSQRGPAHHDAGVARLHEYAAAHGAGRPARRVRRAPDTRCDANARALRALRRPATRPEAMDVAAVDPRPPRQGAEPGWQGDSAPRTRRAREPRVTSVRTFGGRRQGIDHGDPRRHRRDARVEDDAIGEPQGLLRG